MYEMNFHKTAILTFFNEHKIDKFYNFETLYHNTIPFSNVFEEKKSISLFKHFVLTGIPHKFCKPQYSPIMISKSKYF